MRLAGKSDLGKTLLVGVMNEGTSESSWWRLALEVAASAGLGAMTCFAGRSDLRSL